MGRPSLSVEFKIENGAGDEELHKILHELSQNYEARVGWISEEKHVDPNVHFSKKKRERHFGLKSKKEQLYVAQIAAIQEFGTNLIPPRLGMRKTIAANATKWQEIFYSKFKKDWNLENALNIVSLKAASDFQKYIKQVYSPKLSDRTIANRARRYSKKKANLGNLSKPLIDTSQMIKSIRHVILKS